MPHDTNADLKRKLKRALERSDLAACRTFLEELKREAPLSLETRGLELEYLLASGDLKEAESLAGEILELFPASARIHYLAGLVAYQGEDYPRAEALLRESFRLHPHWRSQRHIGRALTQLGRLDEAEALLLSLAPERAVCELDLAWLYERKGDPGRALAAVERYLKVDPRNGFARAERLRIQARALGPEELEREVASLLEHGEEVPEEIVPQYIDALLRRGRVEEARRFVREHREGFRPWTLKRAAWVAYQLGAHDLAMDLFLAVLPGKRGDFKLLGALETAADRAGRLDELLRVYEAHAVEEKRLLGRIRRLRRKRGAEGG